MQRDEKKQRNDELDRFWEIDDLIPKKRAPHYPHDTEAVEIEILSSEQPNVGKEERGRETAIPPRTDAPKPHFIPPHTPEEFSNRPTPILEYTPDNALVRSVRIYPWKGDYRYYEGFLRDAKRLYAVKGQECERVPFFSYVPQYAQMNRAQLEWYLWWRTCARAGEFLDTDYSYVLLYLYEIINLSEVMDAQESQTLLCKLWLRYRSIYRQMDGYLPDWICDYSLIHRLSPPEQESGVTLSSVMTHCTLKEFFVPMGGEEGYLSALLAFCSNYDYTKSKFYSGENVELFDRTVRGALQEVTQRLSRDGKLFSLSQMDDSRMVRDAYTGALCSFRVKRRIEVEYCSFSRSHELRYFITDVVKYTENLLRGALGVRSRLSVYALPVSVRELLDAYCAPRLVKSKPPKKQVEVAAYEKLYDLPKAELSLTNAADIERLSWETTERLVEAFEDDAPLEKLTVEAIEPTVPPVPTLPENPTDSDPWARFRLYLSACLLEDSSRKREALGAAKVGEEVLVDEINTLAADLLGDILLEETDGTFAVIEDYRETLEDILRNA